MIYLHLLQIKHSHLATFQSLKVFATFFSSRLWENTNQSANPNQASGNHRMAASRTMSYPPEVKAKSSKDSEHIFSVENRGLSQNEASRLLGIFPPSGSQSFDGSFSSLKRLFSGDDKLRGSNHHPPKQNCPSIDIIQSPSDPIPKLKRAPCLPYKIKIRVQAIILLILLGIPGNAITIFLICLPPSPNTTVQGWDFNVDGNHLNQSDAYITQHLSNVENCWEDCSMPNETMSNTSHVSSDVYCYEPFDEDFWPTVDANKYWIQGWFLLIVACIGSIGNILTIVVLKNFDNKSSFNSLLIGLMSLDSVLLLFAIYDWSLLDGFGRKEPEWHIYLFPYLIHPLKSMTGTACVYMVVAVAAERYHAICHPLKYKPSPCTYIIMVLLISFLVNVSKFFEFKLTTSEKENSTELVYTTTELNEQATYVVFSSYHECLIGEVLPLLALCILNFQISIKIWNSGKMNHRHLGPTKSDLHTEDEAISNYNSPSLHSSTKRPNGRQVILETSFRANGGQRVDLHRSQSTFLTPRNPSRTTCRGGTPSSCSSHSTRPLGGLEDSVSDHHVNGQAVLANSEPIAPTTITGSHLTSISLHSSSCLYKRKSIKSSEKRFQNRREKSIGILVCIITIFFACHLFQVGIQIFQICLPGHGLKDYYKECEQQKRSHVPAIIYTLGFTNRLLLVVNSSVNFLIYCIMAKRFRTALVKLLLSMRKRLFRGNCEFV